MTTPEQRQSISSAFNSVLEAVEAGRVPEMELSCLVGVCVRADLIGGVGSRCGFFGDPSTEVSGELVDRAFSLIEAGKSADFVLQALDLVAGEAEVVRLERRAKLDDPLVKHVIWALRHIGGRRAAWILVDLAAQALEVNEKVAKEALDGLQAIAGTIYCDAHPCPSREFLESLRGQDVDAAPEHSPLRTTLALLRMSDRVWPDESRCERIRLRVRNCLDTVAGALEDGPDYEGPYGPLRTVKS